MDEHYTTGPDTLDEEPRRLLGRWLPLIPAWLIALGFGVLVLLTGAVLDVAVQRLHESLWHAVALSDIVSATVAALLFWRLLWQERERRKAIRRRLEIVAETNHHIRNATYVISLSTHNSQDKETVRMIQDSIKRIDWTLKQILSKL
jgi:hypothetical protein